ncbi:hypothetical protein [Ferrovum sp.]|uniref:hypothetical protein n=1 Tax=Ferrovum sp. TaxID=2609467 RepID=UPI0026390B99|nr:hypothetical protein [Ferrovum sp.]
MDLSQDPSQQFVNEDGTPATWLEARTPERRRRSFLLFAVPGGLLGLALWGWQIHAGVLTWSNWWVGALFAGGGLLIGGLAYLPAPVRQFSGILVHYTPRERLKRSWGWLLAWLLLELFFAAEALGLSFVPGPLDPWLFGLLTVAVCPVLIHGLTIYLRREERVLTPAAAAAKTYFSPEADRQRQAAAPKPESPAQKRLRYVAALVLAAVDVYLWAAAPFGANHWPAILCGLAALVCAAELAAALVALALGAVALWALFAGAAALPVSAAVIIGAIIIAAAVRR